MPKPSEIVNSFLETKMTDGLDFILNRKTPANTIYENIKLNRKNVEEETIKKQNSNFQE